MIVMFLKRKLPFIIPLLIIALWGVGTGSMLMMGMLGDTAATHHGIVTQRNCPFSGLPALGEGSLISNSCFDVHANLVSTTTQVLMSNFFSTGLLLIIIVASLLSLWLLDLWDKNTPQKIFTIYYKRDTVTIRSIIHFRLGKWLALHEKRDPQPALAAA